MPKPTTPRSANALAVARLRVECSEEVNVPRVARPPEHVGRRLEAAVTVWVRLGAAVVVHEADQRVDA